jgi:outer membrane protein W
VAPSDSPLPAADQVKEPQGPLADAKDAQDEHAFSWFSAAPELGYTFFPEAAMQVNGFKATVNARNGFVAKLHLDLGGDGLSFEIAPLFAVEAGGIDQSGGSFGSTSVDPRNLSGSFQSIGAQLGAVYRFEISRFYPHVGLGLHAAYVMGRDIEYGAEIYGRIPLGFTLYLAKHLGLVVEAGFMYGVTGIKQPFSNIDTAQLVASAGLDQQAADELSSINSRQELEQWLATYESQLSAEQAATLKQDVINNALAQSIRFGNGFGLDLMIGLRFP